MIVNYCSGSFLFLNKPRHPCGAPFLDTKRFLFAKLFCQQKMSMCTISFPKKASISAAFGRGLQWSEHLWIRFRGVFYVFLNTKLNRFDVENIFVIKGIWGFNLKKLSFKKGIQFGGHWIFAEMGHPNHHPNHTQINHHYFGSALHIRVNKTFFQMKPLKSQG